MQAKEKVLDRIEQSVVLFKNHFVSIYAPVFILQVSIYMLFYMVLIKMIRGINPSHPNLDSLFQDIVIFVPILLIYLVLQMILVIGSYKTISDAYHNREYNLVDNYMYACNHFFEIFKTYYYIFLYVYLIPCVVFIVGGLYVIYLVDSGGLILTHTGLEGENLTGGFRWEALAGIAFVYFIITFFYVTYRGLKTSFALPSAIDAQEYTHENFKTAVAITNNNWWRIIGNLMLVGIMGGLLTSIFSGVLSAIIMATQSASVPPSNIESGKTTMIANEISKIFDTSVSPQSIIVTGINRFFGTILFAFTLVFLFFLYQRLKAEYLGETDETPENKQKNENENEAIKQPTQEIL